MPNPPPAFEAVDHIHVFVRDRRAAEAWYRAVLGLHRVEALLHWAADGGPLTLSDTQHRLRLALFERPVGTSRQAGIALRTHAAGFRAWQRHLTAHLPQPPSFEDHGLSHSLYFNDPDGNAFEVTCYEVESLR